MTRENAKKLQSTMAKEAVTLLMRAENMPPDEGDVPLALTGREVIELERDLFETAVRLNDRDKRQQLFNTAQAAAEWFSLEDWITGTQEESGHRGA